MARIFHGRIRSFARRAAGLIAGAGAAHWVCRCSRSYLDSDRDSDGGYLTSPIQCRDGTTVVPWSAPSRDKQIATLKRQGYDVLVVGGGCVGAGVALESATRGLKTAMIERDDFAAGTSSRSTKLIHGGIRYLENAVWKLDYGSLKLVDEALSERMHLLQAAPYMAHALPIMIPLYKWWELPYMLAGAMVYDFVAGSRRHVPRSSMLSKDEALYRFPQLDPDGLKGAIVYYDGMHNDARMNLMIALTAAQEGATVANYTSLQRLVKRGEGTPEEEEILKAAEAEANSIKRKKSQAAKADAQGEGDGILGAKEGEIIGAVVKDEMEGKEFAVRARRVVNATGPFADAVRKMADPEVEEVIVPAGGVHVILPDHMCPDRMGLIVPKTKDGRVLFFLPWEGRTLCGTTDSTTDLTMLPQPTEKEISFILDEANKFLNTRVSRHDVKSAWSGIRPLVRDPNAAKGDTKSFSRNHVIEHFESSGLVSTMGGKWTTYRRMAQDTVDKLKNVTPEFEDKVEPSRTLHMQFLGADRAGIVVGQKFDRITVTLRETYDMDKDVAQHLLRNYGTRALQVAELVKRDEAKGGSKRMGKRLSRKMPFIRAEVHFAVEQEYAQRAVDVIARRTRVSFLDYAACTDVCEQVIEIMGEKLGWTSARKQKEMELCQEFISTMQ